MINKGEYIVHYTNIRERGVFPKIAFLLTEFIGNTETYQNDLKLHEKYDVTKETVNIFKGYLALFYKK